MPARPLAPVIPSGGVRAWKARAFTRCFLFPRCPRSGIGRKTSAHGPGEAVRAETAAMDADYRILRMFTCSISASRRN